MCYMADSHPMFSLFKQAKDGELMGVKQYLDNHPNFSVNQWFFGVTLLHSAVEGNQVEVVKYLLTKGADPTVSLGFMGLSTYAMPAIDLAANLHEEEVYSLLKCYEEGMCDDSGLCSVDSMSMNAYDIEVLFA